MERLANLASWAALIRAEPAGLEDLPFTPIWHLWHLSWSAVSSLGNSSTRKSPEEACQFLGGGITWHVMTLMGFCPEPPFQAEQPQLSQPFLFGVMLQTLHHLCGTSLDSLQYVCVFPVSGSTGVLGTVLQVWPHQRWVQWKDHLSQPAGKTLRHTAQDTISLHCCKATLLAHLHPGAHVILGFCASDTSPSIHQWKENRWRSHRNQEGFPVHKE